VAQPAVEKPRLARVVLHLASVQVGQRHSAGAVALVYTVVQPMLRAKVAASAASSRSAHFAERQPHLSHSTMRPEHNGHEEVRIMVRALCIHTQTGSDSCCEIRRHQLIGRSTYADYRPAQAPSPSHEEHFPGNALRS
jgi:hypothetical protein